MTAQIEVKQLGDIGGEEGAKAVEDEAKLDDGAGDLDIKGLEAALNKAVLPAGATEVGE